MAIKLADILSGENLAERLSGSALEEIGHDVLAGVKADKASRSEWEERSAQAMKLALQVVGVKNFPFEGASNVKLPVITIAAMQFHARAYPALVPGTDIVRMRVIGEDPSGEKAKRASRIASHMSYQVLDEDEEWEEQFDQLLLALPVEGCEFKKSWFDPAKGHNVSQWVRPEDLLVPYYTKSLLEAERITHILHPHPRTVKEHMRDGYYREVELSPSAPEGTPAQDARDERQGIRPSTDDKVLTLYEQHTWLDLDEDGLTEPYVVTVADNGAVLRLAPRFTAEGVDLTQERVARIRPIHHFTKYPFIPSPDGGFYDLGLGHLLGPLNESINTVLNQIVDSGSMYNLQAGFLGKGARLKGGDTPFKMGEWKKIEFQGDDLKKAVMMLPVREPSGVLFSVLGFLVDYANRLGSVNDAMVGQNPGQNQPATTTMAVMEQGMMVMNGIFKRIYRSLRQEFRKLYELNRIYLDPISYFQVLDTGQDAEVYLADYREMDGKDIRPSADPNMASSAQTLAKATALRQAAYTGTGYDVMKVEHRYLEALKIPNIEEIHPIENPIKPQPDPKLMIEQAKIQQRAAEQQMKYTMQMEKLAISARKEEAEILNLNAQAALALAKAEREGEVADLEVFKAGLDAAERRRQSALEVMRILKEINGGQSIPGMEGAPADGGVLPAPEGMPAGDVGVMG